MTMLVIKEHIVLSLNTKILSGRYKEWSTQHECI